MFTISNNNIVSMTRGDSGYIFFDINLGNDFDTVYYELGEFDTVYFGVMESNKPFEHAIIKKVYKEKGSSKASFRLVSEDTEFLVPGVYYYSVKINKYEKETSSYSVITLIPKKKFIIID